MAPRSSISSTWSREWRASALRDIPGGVGLKSPTHKPALPRIWLVDDLLPCAADRSRSWLHRERLAVTHQRPRAARDAADVGGGRGHRCERLASGGEARRRRVPLVGRGRPRVPGAPRPGRQLRPLRAAACVCGWPETAAPCAAALEASAARLRRHIGRRRGRPSTVARAALIHPRAGSCVVRGRPFGAPHGSAPPPRGWRVARRWWANMLGPSGACARVDGAVLATRTCYGARSMKQR
jgi:hypothetical protein